MNKNLLSVATITLVRDDEEEQLLRESMLALAAHDVPVYITDGGSPAHFIDFLRGFPNFILSGTPAKGLLAQVANSLSAAYAAGADYILYSEPDKKHFFQEGLSPFLEQASVNAQTGVLLASRTAAGFASYPAFQRMTETTINNCCTEVTGHALDYTYGPFLMSCKLIPHLKFAQEDLAWGWRPYIFTIAHRLGLRLEEYQGAFFCPPQQQQDSAEERVYRMKQLEQNVRGVVLGAGVGL